MRSRARVAVTATVTATALMGCQSSTPISSKPAGEAATTTPTPSAASTKPAAPGAVTPAPASGSAPGVYAGTRAGSLSGAAVGVRPRVYVPNTISNRVDVIDPATYKVIRSFPVGLEPQHVVPSWDKRTLWVNNDHSDELVPIDARTGKVGRSVKVTNPYNLYFSPNGKYALVMAEQRRRIDIRDAQTMRLVRSIKVPCRGVNHADFTADGAWMLASCEFSGKLLVVPASLDRVSAEVDLNSIRTKGASDPVRARSRGGPPASLDRKASAMPQDVRLTADGRTFLVADMLRNGVWRVDARTRKVLGFLPTGKGAHGIYPSRDASKVYVTNRDNASVSVLDATGSRIETTWRLPRGSSPDMGGVTADGRQLWLSGRYDAEIYVIDTSNGRLLRRIPTGRGPHGLTVWPQPGRYSLGHTGNMR